jgi:integrase
VVWDERVPSFGVRVSPKGIRSYMVKYRAGGQQRRTRLGRHGLVTVDEARRRAEEILGRVAGREDPGQELVERRRSPTVAELAERFMKEHVLPHRKPKTAKDYRLCIRRILASPLATKTLCDLEVWHLVEFHSSMARTPYLANRTRAVLSKMLNLSEKWGLRPRHSNPCRDVDKYNEAERSRFLSPGEYQQLWRTLAQLDTERPEMRPALNAIRLLALTGCRLSEIQTLRWADVRENALELPDGKTGARKVALCPEAIAVLGSIERLSDNPYVITGTKPGQHLTDLERPWRRIRARAGLDEVRIHDLRHSFASAAVANGESLPMIGKLLGHRQVQTTARYAHLADDPVHAAAARVGGVIAAAIGGRDALPR